MGSNRQPGHGELRPGVRGGLEAVVKEAFGEPTRPSLTRAEVVDLVRAKLRSSGIRFDRILISDATVRPRALFDAAGQRVAFPEGELYRRCFVALVDVDSAAKWAHPAYYAFVPAAGDGEVEFVRTDLPPHHAGPVRLIPVEPKP